MDKIIKEQINFKLNDIDKLFSEYELIFEKIKQEEPDLFDMTILGSVLHSFYNGLENIFEIIAKNIDNSVPSGNKSHHFYRHAYSFQFNWEKMKPLVDNVNVVWQETKNEILVFLSEEEI